MSLLSDLSNAISNLGKPQVNYAQPGGYSPANYTSPYAALDNALGNQAAQTAGAAAAAGITDPTFWQSMLGYTNDKGVQQQGWGGLALGAASALGNGWMGMKQYGLAKDAFKESKRQYNQNYAAQRQTLNTQLEDRQRARVASNPGAYQSVGEYMDQNRIR